jgi:phage-related protein
MSAEDQAKWLDNLMHSNAALTFQMDKQTNALAAQTGQLSKITDALEPYLNFMRTLNEIAALSTLSTADLNSGLDSIRDTLVNLGSALSGFDLKTAMDGLFGAEGSAKEFMTTMADSSSDFDMLIKYIERLSQSVTVLVGAFDSLSDINESVLSDENALKEVFQDMIDIMNNFSKTMVEAGFGEKLAEEMEKMVNSAKPLIDYFRENNAAVKEFNASIMTFKTTLTNVIDVMEKMKAITEVNIPTVDELSEAFDNASEVIRTFDDALSKHMGVKWRGADKFEVIDEEAFSDNLITNIAAFGEHWTQIEKAVGDSIDTFIGAATTISDLTSAMEKLDVLADLTVSSADDMADGFERAKYMIKEFDKALTEHMGVRWMEDGAFEVIDEEAFSDNLITNIAAFGEHWTQIEKAVGDSIDTFVTAVTAITDLMGAMILLTKTVEEFDKIAAIDIDKLGAGLDKIAKAARELDIFLETDTWKAVTADLETFSKKWKEVNGNIKDSADSFAAFSSVMSSIVSSSGSLISAITDIGDVSVITSEKIEEAFGAIPKMMAEITEYLGSDSFKVIKDGLSDLNTEYLLHKDILDKIMPSFESATAMFSTLAQQVISVSSAFLALKDSTVISGRDMEKAIDNIKTFTTRFTEALRLNLGSLVVILTALDVEWKKHSKDMEDIMPSFKSATSDISSLVGTVMSLTSALKRLSETSATTSGTFDKGFGSLIKSVSNFTVSLAKNVGPLISSLQQLRKVWVENEEVLVPLMKDFRIITMNLKSVADNANAMKDSFREINRGWVLLERGFDRLVEFIKTTVEAIKEFYTPEAAAEVSTFIKDIGKVIDSFKELNSKIEGALNDIKSKISGAVKDIETRLLSLSNLNERMFNSGANLIGSFINGINSMQEALEVTLENIANTIKAYLGVASPTELGALKNVDEWPRNLVKSFSEGIEAEMGMINNSFSGMVAPAIVNEGRGGGNRTSVTFHVTQHITDRKTADYTTKELERMLNRHLVM